jgi:hypothetical protein
VAPEEAFLSIGVTAPTQEEATEKFCSVYKRWIEILAIDKEEAAN